MPPKQSITKEMIIEAGFKIVRKNGIAFLSARNVAKKLGCSTQPVYSCFKTIKALEQAITLRAGRFIQDHYLVSKTNPDNNFKSIGLGYIALAKKDKHLFDFLYVSGRVRLDFENHLFPVENKILIHVMRKDPYLATLSEKELLTMLTHMWIYTHGLTVLTSTNPQVSEAFILKKLDEMGSLVVKNKLMEKGILKNENHCD